jgi:hypothetical protein
VSGLCRVLAPISVISFLFMLTLKIIFNNRYSHKLWCIVGQGMCPTAPKQVPLQSKHPHWCRARSSKGAHIMHCPLWTRPTWVHIFHVVHSLKFVFYWEHKYIGFLKYLRICKFVSWRAHTHALDAAQSSSHGGTPNLYHIVSISSSQFFLCNQRPGLETGHQNTLIGSILESQALNLWLGQSPRMYFFKVCLFQLF